MLRRSGAGKMTGGACSHRRHGPTLLRKSPRMRRI
jgi:hypothetical protein